MTALDQSRPRQPLFWAALTFAAGVLAGASAWRPPTWWVGAALVFLAAGIYFLRRRPQAAMVLPLAALVALGALAVQLHDASTSTPDLSAYAGREVVVTGHALRDGVLREAIFSGWQQSLDLEVEEIASGETAAKVSAGLRLSIYYRQQEEDDEGAAAPPALFHYGQRLRIPAKLRLPRNYGNPGAMDVREYLARQGIVALGSAKAERIELLAGPGGSRLGASRAYLRRKLLQQMRVLWSEREAPLLSAMLIGERALISRQTKEEFQRTGAYHILVVSGLNVGILALAVFWTLRHLRAGDAVSTLITILVTGAYAWVTDMGSPILRATLMLWLYLGARLLYRDRRSGLNAIGAAALFLLVAEPRALLDASFQMTFVCVLAIAGIGLPLLERTSGRLRQALAHLDSVEYDVHLPPRLAQFRLDLRLLAGRLARLLPTRYARPLASRALVGSWRTLLAGYEVLLISVLMQVAMVLPMAVYAHRAALLSVPANVVIVPATGVLMPAAFVATALSFLSLKLAWLPALVTSGALRVITNSVQVLGEVHAAGLRLPTPTATAALAAVLGLVLAIATARRRRRLAIAGLAVLALSAAWIVMAPSQPRLRPGALEVTALDVGQGDSLFVVSPQGKTLLMDAGGLPGQARSRFDLGEDVVSPYLWSRRIARLDVVAISHAHADHMGGMRAVIANFRPRELWLGTMPPEKYMGELLRAAAENGVTVRCFSAGDTFSLGGAAVEVLSPPAGWNADRRPHNNDSLVLRFTYGGKSVLLEGDAEKKIERMLAQREPQADVLKVGHHGSATSTLPEFLTVVRPRFAVISAGHRNSYGYPHPQVLSRLQRAGVRTYRTDLTGAVTFYLHQGEVEVTLPNRR